MLSPVDFCNDWQQWTRIEDWKSLANVFKFDGIIPAKKLLKRYGWCILWNLSDIFLTIHEHFECVLPFSGDLQGNFYGCDSSNTECFFPIVRAAKLGFEEFTTATILDLVKNGFLLV